MSTIVDFTTRVTFEFVSDYLPRQTSCRVIDVGCGRGGLSRLLADSGHRPLAIDSDADLLTDIKSAGIDCRASRWADIEPELADAVVFNRSLHHLPPVGDAIARASDCIPRGGVIIVEDFAFDEVDSRSIDWFMAQASELASRSLLAPESDSFLERMVSAGDPHQEWRRDHQHIVPADQMRAALSAFGELVHETNAPYLFRYFATSVLSHASPDEVLQSLYQSERHLIESGQSAGIGRRWVMQREWGRSSSVSG